MAQRWVLTGRKRLMLAAIDAAAAVLRATRSPGGLRGALAPADVRSILVLELWNLGDVILAMPFLAALRERFPGAHVTLLARPHARTLLAGTGLVDEVLETDLSWRHADTALAPPAYRWRELRRVWRLLRAREFDLAFQCRMLVRERAILAAARARRRVSYAFGSGDRPLTDAVAVTDPDLHRVADWMRLLEPFGPVTTERAPRLAVSEAERREAAELLCARGIGAHDVVVGVHPGASVPEKRWPLEHFAAVAGSLAGEGVRVLAFVEPGRSGGALGAIPGVVSVQVGLRELVALIARCDLLVCNDSGPMHIAGAAGVPTVAVFEPGIARWFAPLGDGHTLIERDGATPGRVLEAVHRALGARATDACRSTG